MHELLQNTKIMRAIVILLMACSFYVAGQFINGLKENSFIGRTLETPATINVSGTGEAFAAPDVANISFAVTKDAKTVAEAQKLSADGINAIMAFLKEKGIDKKDIQTTSYNLYPKYEYQKAVTCLDYNMNGYCPQGKQILMGYTVSQSVAVKVRKIDDAGTIIGGLGEKGATDISGINLEVDEPEAVQAEARDEAIKDAKDKAQTLAKSLGVRLVRIVSYSDGGNYPAYREYGIGGGAKLMAADMAAPAPEIPVGQNQYSSNVTITYEIQ
jgi:uncharacterized protein YggE